MLVRERERKYLFILSSITYIRVCPNDLRSCPINRFLHGSQFLQMTKIPLELLYTLEITNLGYNGNMSFLVLQVNSLQEGSIDLINVFTSYHVSSSGFAINASFITSSVMISFEQLHSSFRASSVHLRTPT